MKTTILALLALGALTACGVNGEPAGYENGTHISGEASIGVTGSL